MIVRSFYVPIYRCTVKVIFASTLEEVEKRFKLRPVGNAAALSWAEKESVFCCAFTPKTLNTLCVVHESKHIVNSIFRVCGVGLDTGNDEAECYLLEFVVGKILNQKDKLKKEISKL